ncbi:hypothetical protein BaRGS_00014240 [Batillaria attramentaria]|uniref:Apple domain-containing protein n=1 Tax=Batillaria attramentaria TaxID=370345 RepID=A0ABD0L5H9_9CAEN
MNTTGGLFAPGARHYRLKDRKEADGGTSLTTTATTVTVDSTTTSTTAASTQGACPKATLQDDFLQYPWRYITSNNLYSRYATFDVCKTECLNTPDCRSLDYKYSDNTCTGADVTPLQVPSDWRSSEGFSRVDYFQRMCA